MLLCRLVVSIGKCFVHGGDKRRAYPGCSNQTKARGTCFVHGGGQCSKPGCLKSVQWKGLCASHGGSRPCSYPGCNKRSSSRGKCFEHGAGKQCSYPGVYQAGASEVHVCEAWGLDILHRGPRVMKERITSRTDFSRIKMFQLEYLSIVLG
ncbi:hypothetical protein JG688_00017070 [Phytophthora aleatoria]|uniref:WRKY19-like zinc finger domain-containing protein n=1 Tax=Phytophthora aleatoria TaxID=2496075 RepID=A0A8J5I770_9STRA|nr:hypothetical protein JG688_00017070 [Phytophthora aleatoria]